jgi:hypothetical protein
VDAGGGIGANRFALLARGPFERTATLAALRGAALSVRDPRPDDTPLCRLRLERQTSLRQLAALTGMSRGRLWVLENGLRPRRSELLKIAAALNIDPSALNPEATHEAR